MSKNTSLRTDSHRQSTSQYTKQQADSTVTCCPECGGSVALDESPERICQACGRVVAADRIDHCPEWRAFTADEMDRKFESEIDHR
jgi:transcription initiation factor TFIIB